MVAQPSSQPADASPPVGLRWLLKRLDASGPTWACALALATVGCLLIADHPYSRERRFWLAVGFILVPVGAASAFSALTRRARTRGWARVSRRAIAAGLALLLVDVIISLVPMGHAFFSMFFPVAYPSAAVLFAGLAAAGVVLTWRRALRGEPGASRLLPGRVHLMVGVVAVAVVAFCSVAWMFSPHTAERCRSYEGQPGVRLVAGAPELIRRGLYGWANVYQLEVAPETDTVYATFKYWAGLHLFADGARDSNALMAARSDGRLEVVAFPGDEAPEYLAWDGVHRTLYVNAFKRRAPHDMHIYRDDGSRLEPLAVVPLPFEDTQPSALSIDPATERLYVFDNYTGVAIYDVSDPRAPALLERRVLTERAPLIWDLVETGPGRGYLAAFEHPDVWVDVPAGEVRVMAEGGGAVGGGWDPSGQVAAVCDILGGDVRLYDGTGAYKRSLALGVHGRDAQPLAELGLLAVGAYVSGHLHIVRLDDGAPVAEVVVGRPLRTLDVDRRGTLYAGTSCGIVAVDLGPLRAP